MDRDRSEGSMKKIKGDLKEAAGNITGDAKLKSDGRQDQAEGKVQNAFGGLKDAIRGKR